MKVLAVVPNQLGWAPGQRSTIEAWEPLLTEHGITVDYAVFETERLHQVLYSPGRYGRKVLELGRAFVGQIDDVRHVRRYDAVYLYREAALAGPAVLERLIARSGVPIVYELDDPLHVPYRSVFNGGLARLKFRGKVAKICAMSAAVIANSTMIRRFAETHNDNVWQIPSVVDSRQYVYEPKPLGARVCVGWSGSASTARNLAVVTNALRRFQAEVDADIHFIGAHHFDVPGVRFTSQPWRAESEVGDLRRLDVGLVPLPDEPWNHHKFYLKVAQYMALGIVPVATPMGSIPEDIQVGENGFIAATEDEWVEHLTRLVRDDELRHRLSTRAAADAATRYTIDANAEKVLGAFRSVVG